MYAANQHLHAENSTLQATLNLYKEKEAMATARSLSTAIGSLQISQETQQQLILQMATIMGLDTVALKPKGALPCDPPWDKTMVEDTHLRAE